MIIKPDLICIKGFVGVMLEYRNGKKEIFKMSNIVTNDGDDHYALMGARQLQKYDFVGGGCKLGTSATAPTKTDTDVNAYVSGTYVSLMNGYPTTNDSDSDNPYNGYTNYITWKYHWIAEQGNGSTIAEGAIVEQETSPGAALCHFLISPTIPKTLDFTITIWVNHKLLGS